MNWGHKITIVIISFVLAMLGMVYIAMQQTNDMIDDKYYEKELKYQLLINASNNLKKIERDTILYQNKTHIEIKLPNGSYGKFLEGTYRLLKPNDKRKDRESDFTPDSLGNYHFSKKGTEKGYYLVRIKWKNDTTLYYKEQYILIN